MVCDLSRLADRSSDGEGSSLSEDDLFKDCIQDGFLSRLNRGRM